MEGNHHDYNKRKLPKNYVQKKNRILIKIAICLLCIFLIVKWTEFVSSQYGNNTPTSAIKTSVKDEGIKGFYHYVKVFKSLFLEVEEVDNKECQYILDDPDFNKETQKVYQITKNVPGTVSGYWIVTEINTENQKQYLAKYYGY